MMNMNDRMHKQNLERERKMLEFVAEKVTQMEDRQTERKKLIQYQTKQIKKEEQQTVKDIEYLMKLMK